jgi:hypothetical protein
MRGHGPARGGPSGHRGGAPRRDVAATLVLLGVVRATTTTTALRNLIFPAKSTSRKTIWQRSAGTDLMKILCWINALLLLSHRMG